MATTEARPPLDKGRLYNGAGRPVRQLTTALAGESWLGT